MSPRIMTGSRATMVLLLALAPLTGGCAAAVGAAMAAQELRQGFAGIRALVSSTRPVETPQLETVRAAASPLAGTYRAVQVLEADTLLYYVRTVSRPSLPIVDSAGVTTGYALAGIAATSLDTLEVRVGQYAAGTLPDSGGRAFFFIEGVKAPDPAARSLYPAAFLGRVASGESEAADRQHAALRALELDLEAPRAEALRGQGIAHETFGSVADGIFTLSPDGSAAYQQEYETSDDRSLTLRFERISTTTLPDP